MRCKRHNSLIIDFDSIVFVNLHEEINDNMDGIYIMFRGGSNRWFVEHGCYLARATWVDDLDSMREFLSVGMMEARI